MIMIIIDKSWYACSLFQYLSGKTISSPPSHDSMLFIVMNSSLLVANNCRGVGGKGVSIPVLSLVIVSKIACQHIFVVSDPDVPRTFVGDCSFLYYMRHVGYLAFRLFEAPKPFKCILVRPNREGSSVQVVTEMLDSVYHDQHLLLGGAVPTLAVLERSAGVCDHFLISALLL